jgi:hypothetical protein
MWFSLILDDTAVSDAGLVHLQSLGSLKTLGLMLTAVTQPGADAFVREWSNKHPASPRPELTWSDGNVEKEKIN